ncbi:MAG: hypothetical protein CMI56_00230 [Parcubacteria group bacterium]|nr:hypothetical protein [Parcubacteria group bacterium]
MCASKAKVDGQLEVKNKELQESNANYNKIVDNQRKYFKALKDFQEECDLNEELSRRLEQSSK